MATATQIKALLASHGAGDDERFRAVALQVAAAEAIKEMLILDLPKVTNKALAAALTERRLHLNQPIR